MVSSRGPLSPLSDDDDEIVFSPRLSNPHAAIFHDFNSDDDFILIPSSPASRVASPPSLLIGSMAGLSLETAAQGVANSDIQSPPAIPSDYANSATAGTVTNTAPLSLVDNSHTSSGLLDSLQETCKATTQTQTQLTNANAATSGTVANKSQHALGRTAPKPKKPVQISSISYPSPSPSPVTTPKPSQTAECSSKKRESATKAAASEKRSNEPGKPAQKRQRKAAIADNSTCLGSHGDDDLLSSSTYQNAASYITRFLSDPNQESAEPRLPLLKAFIIELGLVPPASSTLPGSIKAAKALLKAKAHLNIRDYVNVRAQGLEAIKKIMFPNRKQLMKDLRRRRVPLKWVKEHGLSVFLISML